MRPDPPAAPPLPAGMIAADPFSKHDDDDSVWICGAGCEAKHLRNHKECCWNVQELAELTGCLSVCRRLGAGLTAEQLEQVVSAYDTDGDGTVRHTASALCCHCRRG